MNIMSDLRDFIIEKLTNELATGKKIIDLSEIKNLSDFPLLRDYLPDNEFKVLQSKSMLTLDEVKDLITYLKKIK